MSKQTCLCVKRDLLIPAYRRRGMMPLFHTDTHTHTETCMQTHSDTRICAIIRTFVYNMYMCASVCVCIHPHTPQTSFSEVGGHICIQRCICMYEYVCACLYLYIHTSNKPCCHSAVRSPVGGRPCVRRTPTADTAPLSASSPLLLVCVYVRVCARACVCECVCV